ncbi:MAG: branched-chain amino acid ABC transporter permease [Proteobacteria bacterium]|nr:branched-chain amino acid ABC transporter permease [Pseudomonadota bacterium]
MIDFIQFSVSGLLIGGLYALVAASVVLVFKSTQMVSIAHGQFLAFGALFFWIFIELGCPIWLSLALTFVLVGMMGFIVQHFTIRPLIGRHLFTAFIMTFAIFMFLDGIFQLFLGGQSRTLPALIANDVLRLGGVAVSKTLVVSFLASLAAFLAIATLFAKRTIFGLGMRAVAEDHRLAQSTGISVKNVFVFIWIVSALVAAMAGIAIVNVMDIQYPLPYIGVKGLIVAMFGGMESIGGALLAGLILGVLENISAGYLDPILGGGVREVAAYVVLLVILMVKPYGLFGLPRIERV